MGVFLINQFNNLLKMTEHLGYKIRTGSFINNKDELMPIHIVEAEKSFRIKGDMAAIIEKIKDISTDAIEQVNCSLIYNSKRKDIMELTLTAEINESSAYDYAMFAFLITLIEEITNSSLSDDPSGEEKNG